MNVGQQIINGLVLGHAYALVAIGWTVLLGVAKLVNFGHGQMYMLGAFTTWWVMAQYGLPYVVAVPVSMVVGIVIGYLMQRIMLQLTIRQDLVSIMIVTLGFGHVLGGVASLLFGSTGQILNTPLSTRNVYVGSLWFTYQDVAIVVVTIVVFLALKLVMERTRLGRLARMVAEDPKLAQLAGIDVKKVYLGIFAFEGAAVALAAALGRTAHADPDVHGLRRGGAHDYIRGRCPRRNRQLYRKLCRGHRARPLHRVLRRLCLGRLYHGRGLRGAHRGAGGPPRRPRLRRREAQ